MKKIFSLLILLILIPQVLRTQTPDKKIYETEFSGSHGLRGKIELSTSSLEIQTNSGSKVVIKIFSSTSEGNSEYNVTQTSGGFTLAQTVFSDNITRKIPVQKVLISVPQYYNFDINTARGDVFINRIDGNLNIKTASGKVELVDCTGYFEVASASGNLTFRNCTGEKSIRSASADVLIQENKGKVKVSSASGDVSVNSSEGVIEVSTASGDVSVNTSSELYNIDTKSQSGNLRIKIPSSAGVNLEIRTISGSVIIDDGFVISNESGDRTKMTIATLNDGGIKINCHTVSGNIEIRK